MNLGLDAALDGMKKGEIFASLLVSGKPVDALARYAQADGIHLLPIPYSKALQQDYLPSTFRREDYPNIIGTGKSVDTIARWATRWLGTAAKAFVRRALPAVRCAPH